MYNEHHILVMPDLGSLGGKSYILRESRYCVEAEDTTLVCLYLQGGVVGIRACVMLKASLELEKLQGPAMYRFDLTFIGVK
jgi:hypothetical protein